MFFSTIKNNIFIRSFTKLLKDHGIEHAGYLAYLNIFSLFPLFIIISTVVGEIADGKTSSQLTKIILEHIPNYSSLVNRQIKAIINGPSVGIISFASISALWTTTSSLEGMRTIFNKIYKVKTPPFFVKSRIISILQFILILIALIAIIFGFIIFPKMLMMLDSFFNVNLFKLLKVTKYNIDYTATLFIIFAIVTLLYYFLLNKKIAMMSVLPGSILTTFLWAISAKFMSIFLKQQLAQLSLVYGSLSGILSILLFFYIANVILIYGAEFNYNFRNWVR